MLWYWKAHNRECNSNRDEGFFIFDMAELFSLSIVSIASFVSNEYPSTLILVVKNDGEIVFYYLYNHLIILFERGLSAALEGL